MTTQADIRKCFDELRTEITEQRKPTVDTHGPGAAGGVDHESETELVFMGLFLLESLLIDIKRIADAQERLANAIDETQAEPPGWANK